MIWPTEGASHDDISRTYLAFSQPIPGRAGTSNAGAALNIGLWLSVRFASNHRLIGVAVAYGYPLRG